METNLKTELHAFCELHGIKIKQNKIEKVIDEIKPIPEISLANWVCELIPKVEQARGLEFISDDEIKFIIKLLKDLGFNDLFRPLIEYWFFKGNWQMRGRGKITTSDFFPHKEQFDNDNLIQDYYVPLKYFENIIKIFKENYENRAENLENYFNKFLTNRIFIKDRNFFTAYRQCVSENLRINSEKNDLLKENEGYKNRLKRLEELFDTKNKLILTQKQTIEALKKENSAFLTVSLACEDDFTPEGIEYVGNFKKIEQRAKEAANFIDEIDGKSNENE